MKLTVIGLFAALLMIAPHTIIAQESTDEPEDESLVLLWEQIAAQPQDAAIGCIPLNDPAGAVLYNADERFPLASVTKLLIFIEYARRIDLGMISRDAMVDVSTLDRYNLPRTDRGAYDRFMAQYPDDIEQISLWEVAVGMIQYSSNAASDYLLDLLEPVDWDALYRILSLTSTDAPHSLTMIPLLMNNHDTGNASMDDVAALSVELGETYLDWYVQDEDWREAEIAYRGQRGRQFPAWDVQTAILEQVTASGTVRDFLAVLTTIYSYDNRLSEHVKSMVRGAMRWRENAFINDEYFEYGSKLGFYSGGTLTLVAYGYPYGGVPVISATFLRDIPRNRYNRLLELDSIGNFAHWMNFNGCAELTDSLESRVDFPAALDQSR